MIDIPQVLGNKICKDQKKVFLIVIGECAVEGTLSFSPISAFLSFRKMVKKKRKKATLPKKKITALISNYRIPIHLKFSGELAQGWNFGAMVFDL